MVVSCFGKLPISPEFIRVNAGGEALAAMDSWIQEGIVRVRSSLGANWVHRFLNGKSWEFIFASPGQKEFLVGVFMPSQDRARRTFPLLIFLRIDKEEWPYPIVWTRLVFQEFLKTAKQLGQCPGGKDGVSVGMFKEQVHALGIPDGAKIRGFLETYEAFLGSGYIECSGRGAVRNSKLESGVYVRDQMKAEATKLHEKQKDSGCTDIRFPVDCQERWLPFAQTFWMEWVWRSIHASMDNMSYFWSMGQVHDRGEVVVMRHPLSSISFRNLIESPSQGGDWFSIVHGEAGSETNHDEAPTLMNAVEQRQYHDRLSLAVLLDRPSDSHPGGQTQRRVGARVC